MPDVSALLRSFGRAATTAGLVAAAAAAAGCEPVQCGSSRTDELSAHLDSTVQLATDFEVKRAAEEVGIGVGLVPHHPAMPMPGGIMPVYLPPPSPTPPKP